MSLVSVLPCELLCYIVEFLDGPSLASFSGVCRASRAAVLCTRRAFVLPRTAITGDLVRFIGEHPKVTHADLSCCQLVVKSALELERECLVSYKHGGSTSNARDMWRFQTLTPAVDLLGGLLALKRLRRLDLSGCVRRGKMTDALVECVSGLSTLTDLSLRHHSLLTDRGVQHLARLRLLERLDISDCRRITCGVFEFLSRVTTLRELLMSRCFECSHQRAVPACVSRLVVLEVLNMGNCYINDRDLAQIAQLQALRRLVLSSNYGVTDAGLCYLAAGLRALEDLDVSFTGCVGHVLRDMPQTLQRVNLHGCAIDNASLEAVPGSVSDLRIGYRLGRFTRQGVVHLVGLTTLIATTCHVHDDTLVCIALHLKSLQHLDVSANRLVTDRGVQSLVGLTCLESLCARNLPRVTSAGWVSVSSMRTLVVLQLGGWDKGPAIRQGVDSNSLAGLNNMSQIRRLSVRHTPISNDVFAHVLRLEHLTHLDVSHNRSLTSKGIKTYVNGLCSSGRAGLLVSLMLAHCTKITDTTMQELTKLHNLRELDIAGCHRVTDAGLSHAGRLPRLEVLVCYGVPNVTTMGLRGVRHIPTVQARYIHQMCCSVMSI